MTYTAENPHTDGSAAPGARPRYRPPRHSDHHATSRTHNNRMAGRQMSCRQQTAPPQLCYSKDVTAHPHRPGAHPGHPCPVPASSGQPPSAQSRFQHPMAEQNFSSPLRNRTTLWKLGTVKGVTEDMRSNREEASRIRTLDDDQQSVPPTDDFGDPVGKGVLSGTAVSNTAVHVRPAGPPRPSSITHPETLHCDLQLHCRLAQMDSCLGQFGTVATGATTRRS